MTSELVNVAIERGARRHYNPVQKDAVTFLETGEETSGARTLAMVEVAPGGGPTAHYHKTYTESFEVLEGELEVLVGDETRVLRGGEKATVPRNTLHRFHNATDGRTVFLCEMRPAQPGFEKAIAVGYGLARDGLTRADGVPRNLYHMALLLDWADLRVPGVFTAIEPLMRWLARRAKRRGVDRELEARYSRQLS